MSCNCGLNEIFTDDVSRRDARKFRRRGLDVRARRMLRALEERVGLPGRSTLEIGIGTGGFTIEMLRRGTTASYGVDALANQLRHAQTLADEAHFGDRLKLHEGDFTEIGDQVALADIVVLDRVVCCYPDWRKLLLEATAHARAAIVMSYPRASWYNHMWIKSANLAMRGLRRSFRLHLHSPSDMRGLLAQNGFATELIGYRLPWEMLIATRTTFQF